MRYLVLPSLILGAAACYTPRAVGPGPDEHPTPTSYSATWQQEEPLRASIWVHEVTGYVSVDVNRSAHLAVFAIQPGGMQPKASMIYPAVGFGGQQRFAAGEHVLSTTLSSSPYRLASNRSLVYGAAPTYIVLIASERPMDVAPFMATGYSPWLTEAVRSESPFLMTEELARWIVPDAGRTEWTSAYYIIWPQNWWSDPGLDQAYVWITCPGGQILAVPQYAWLRGWVTCPAQNVNAPADSAQPLPQIKGKLPKRTGSPPGWVSGRRPGERAAVTKGITRGQGNGEPGPLPTLRGTVGKGDRPGDEGGNDGAAGNRPGPQATTGRPVLRIAVPRRPEPGPGEANTTDPTFPDRPGVREHPTDPSVIGTPTRVKDVESRPTTSEPAPLPKVDRPDHAPGGAAPTVKPRVERRSPTRQARPSKAARASKPAHVSKPSRPAPKPKPAASPAPRPKTTPKPTKPSGGGGGR